MTFHFCPRQKIGLISDLVPRIDVPEPSVSVGMVAELQFDLYSFTINYM